MRLRISTQEKDEIAQIAKRQTYKYEKMHGL